MTARTWSFGGIIRLIIDVPLPDASDSVLICVRERAIVSSCCATMQARVAVRAWARARQRRGAQRAEDTVKTYKFADLPHLDGLFLIIVLFTRLRRHTGLCVMFVGTAAWCVSAHVVIREKKNHN